MTVLMMKIKNSVKSLDNNGEMLKKNKKRCNKQNQIKLFLHRIRGNKYINLLYFTIWMKILYKKTRQILLGL